MLHQLHRLRRWAGVDRAVFFSNAAQLLRLVTGPVTMFLVLRHLTPEVQGYAYAFAGIVAMQAFLEMGFSQNILQFASHEFAKLRFTAGDALAGDDVARSRLISLGRLAFGYYAVAAVIFFFAVGIGGHVFFTRSADRFSEASFQELPAFAARLQATNDPVVALLSPQLSPATRDALNHSQADAERKALATALSKDFNQLLAQTNLATALQAAGVALPAPSVAATSTSVSGRALAQSNRRWLEAAFPQAIRPNHIVWQYAWWLVVLAAAGSLAINPAWALLDGCNQVTPLAKFRFWAALNSFGANALALICGAGIYAGAIGALATLLFAVGYFLWRWRGFFRQFRERPQHGTVSWSQEIWPFQWRIAVSWMSGYFVFDIINPIAFYYCGAVEAGRLGMSLQLIRMIAMVALTWIGTKAPRFGMLVAERAWAELDALWRRSTLQVFSFYLLGFGCFMAAVPLVGHFFPSIPARIAPQAVNAWLGGALIAQILTGSMAMELRAHKREPFMWVSLANAVFSAVFMLLCVRYWGITGEAFGYALAIWVLLLPSYQIYRVKRLEYRHEADRLAGVAKFS